MPTTHQAVNGQWLTFDADDPVKAPYTIELPSGENNGATVNLRNINPGAVNNVTVNGLGGTTVESPADRGQFAGSVAFQMDLHNAVTYRYLASRSRWVIYSPIVPAAGPNLVHWSGQWQAGTYIANESVGHEGGTWLALTTTTAEPGSDITAWLPIGMVPGRGGMAKTPDTAGADIGAAWQTLTYDTETIGSYGVLLNPPNGTFSSNWAGLWELRFLFSMSHDDVNRGRFALVRLWNVTDSAVIGSPAYIPIGRNQPGTIVSLFQNFEATPDLLGDEARLEISCPDDTISGITWHTSRAELTQISPPVT